VLATRPPEISCHCWRVEDVHSLCCTSQQQTVQRFAYAETVGWTLSDHWLALPVCPSGQRCSVMLIRLSSRIPGSVTPCHSLKMAWNRSRAVYLEPLSWAEKTLMWIFRIFFPLPRQTHHPDRTSDANQCIAMFTTSLSTVRTNLMTLPGCIGKMEEDSGVYLNVIAWLNTRNSCCLLENTLFMLMLMSSLPFRSSFTSSLLRKVLVYSGWVVLDVVVSSTTSNFHNAFGEVMGC
jgi:hypothetical protein